jgi:hypothetical protein
MCSSPRDVEPLANGVPEGADIIDWLGSVIEELGVAAQAEREAGFVMPARERERVCRLVGRSKLLLLNSRRLPRTLPCRRSAARTSARRRGAGRPAGRRRTTRTRAGPSSDTDPEPPRPRLTLVQRRALYAYAVITPADRGEAVVA